MRFDCRGMGDSTGAAGTFEELAPDLHCAIDTFLAQVPALTEVVLWGLCDAASGALMFGVQHPRVRGLVLLNPWVRTEQTLYRARIRHYYKERLLGRQMWSKVLRGEFDWRVSLRDLAEALRRVRLRAPTTRSAASDATSALLPFQARMAAGLLGFSGPVLLVISGRDLTAKEFLDYSAQDAQWRAALARPELVRMELPQADHTFSSQAWQAQIERATLDWLCTW
jgi:exosortase A-associated hydrolase 1